MKEIEEMVEKLMEASRQQTEMSALTAENLARVTETFAGELHRFRAWEQQHILFSARYYFNFGKADPIGAAMCDRDFLAKSFRAANDEVGAQAVEKNYDLIRIYIERFLDVKAGRGQAKDRPFLQLVPPPESRDSSTAPRKERRRKAPPKKPKG